MKRRHECYLEENVSERLATMAAKPGSSKTAIMANALRAYFDQRAGTTRRTVQSSARQLSLQLGRIERDQQIVAQTLALPARFQLMFTTSLSDPRRAATSTAQDRFKAFIEQVSRRVSSGCGLIEDVLSLTSASETKQ